MSSKVGKVLGLKARKCKVLCQAILEPPKETKVGYVYGAGFLVGPLVMLMTGSLAISGGIVSR